jgi:hypothetical protein
MAGLLTAAFGCGKAPACLTAAAFASSACINPKWSFVTHGEA